MKLRTSGFLFVLSLVILGFTYNASAEETKSEPNKTEKKKGLVDQLSGQGYGMAGCGLGSILFGERDGMVQIFASTTNGIYSNNTFGVTSGTSNCAPEGDTTQAATVFIESNRLAIQNDIARGSGETLSSFLHLVDCSEANTVGRELQKNYGTIFKKNSSDGQVLNAIQKVIQNNKQTAQACTKLS